MSNRPFKFRAYVKDLNIILLYVTVYDSGLIGMDYDAFVNAIDEDTFTAENGSVYTKGDNPQHIMNFLEGDDWIWLEQSQYQLMQFTGLFDKKQKEIYEGDIIRGNKNSFAIEYKFGSFLMRYVEGEIKPSNGFVLAYDFNLDHYEIAGNVYENKEPKTTMNLIVKMLPTEKNNGAIMWFNGKIGTAGEYNPIHTANGAIRQHLYYLAEAEIKKGEWFLDMSDMTIKQSLGYGVAIGVDLKVVCSTDADITPDRIVENSFVRDFIKNYNEGSPIREIELLEK